MAATIAVRCVARASVRTARTAVSLVFARTLATTTTGDDFFNRDIEIRALRRILDNEPQVTVVLGGPSTGKSRLLTHILHDPAGHYAPVHINLRGVAIQDYQELGEQLVSKVPVWTSKENAPQALPDATKRTVGGASKNIEMPDWTKPLERTLKDFTSTLDLLQAALPEWRLRTGTQRKPVLFIDEANKLGRISKKPDDDGAAALKSFLEWCVLNTKEEGRFHVVFASSDSFFMDWLDSLGITSHVFPVVVGDLDRSHAEAYYQHRLELAAVPSDVVVPPFDEVYRVCGGHMMSIRMYMRDALLAATATPRPTSTFAFGGLQDARARLGLVVPHGRTSSKAWGRKQVLDVFAAIHKDGWLTHSDAARKLEESVVKALIDAGVVHYRPKRPIVADLPSQPDEPVLTARTPSERVAMGLIVSRETGSRLPRKPTGPSMT